MLDDYQIYQNAMIRGMPLLMLSHSKVKGSKGLRKLPMPHIDLKVLAGHSFKFVQFTYRASLLSETSAYFKTL